MFTLCPASFVCLFVCLFFLGCCLLGHLEACAVMSQKGMCTQGVLHVISAVKSAGAGSLHVICVVQLLIMIYETTLPGPHWAGHSWLMYCDTCCSQEGKIRILQGKERTQGGKARITLGRNTRRKVRGWHQKGKSIR